MDKSWMKKKRGTSEYVLGVNEFLGFASKSMGSDERICHAPNASSSRLMTAASTPNKEHSSERTNF